MEKNISNILKEVLEEIKPSKEEEKEIKNSLNEFLYKVRKNIKKLKIDVEIFIGGSFAKGTMIRTKKYDVDIFFRFNAKYKNEISDLTEKILKPFKKIKVHGSRDYFRVNMGPSFIIEIIPVKKIKNQKEAENITDLSYSHVNYVKRKLKPEKILDEIRIAKAFCHANNCYGAESYIKGFSGYGLELLVHHYNGFLKFIKAVGKIKDKEVIDIEKQFKNKQEILLDLNGSKLMSPIVLIDPTYKQRNALAALSEETFEKFKKECAKFLKNPSLRLFEEKKHDLDKIKKGVLKKKLEFVLIEVETNKQKGDVAGSKLLKFYNHLEDEIKEYFQITNKGFEYDEGKPAKFFFVTKNKKEIISKGPKTKDKKNSAKFKKKHKRTFTRAGRLYAREKINFKIKGFLKSWKAKNKKRMKEMTIREFKVMN
jgi:tRNA nucleotidyltransferase (CCA-adding enzyme)